MLNHIKNFVRDHIPKKYQVPLKYWYGGFQGTLEREMEILKFLVKPGDQVIDIGGNRGIYAYRFWKLGAKVEVFEPNPACTSVLMAWAGDKPSVKIHSVALSNTSGSANLHIPIDEAGVEHDASASIENAGFKCTRDQLVSMQTLDSFEFKGVSLIKIDVEGHEYSVIEGATMILGSSRPALLIEIEQRHNGKSIDEVFGLILGFGYQGFFMGADGLTTLEDFNASRHQSMQNFGGSKDRYINNFLFLHQDKLANGEYDAVADVRLFK